jgi:hypothetical protein
MSSALLLLLILLAVAASAVASFAGPGAGRASNSIYSEKDDGSKGALFYETYFLVLFIVILGAGIIVNMWGNVGRQWPRVFV